MTEVACPLAAEHGSFATTWGLSAHLLGVHGLTPAEAAARCAASLESQILNDGGHLAGRFTRAR